MSPSFITPSNRYLGLLCFGHLMIDGYAGYIMPILPVISKHLGLSLGEAGVILTVSGMASSTLQPFYGMVIDRKLNFNYMLWGLIIATLFISLTGWADSYWLLLVLVFLGYFGIGIYHPQAVTYTHSLSHQKQNMILSIFYSCGTVGFALGPLISSALVEWGGLKATLWMLLILIPALLFFPKAPKKIDDHLHQHALAPVQSEFKPFTRDETKLLVILCTIGIVRAIWLVALAAYMPFIWMDAGEKLMTIGWIVAISSFIGGPAGILGGSIADRYGEKPILLMSFIPCFFLLTPMLQSTGLTCYLYFIALNGVLGIALATPTVLSLRGIKSNRNLVSAMAGGLSFGIAGMFMPVIGTLGDHFGLQNAFCVLFPLLILGSLAVFLIPRELMTPQVIKN